MNILKELVHNFFLFTLWEGNIYVLLLLLCLVFFFLDFPSFFSTFLGFLFIHFSLTLPLTLFWSQERSWKLPTSQVYVGGFQPYFWLNLVLALTYVYFFFLLLLSLPYLRLGQDLDLS